MNGDFKKVLIDVKLRIIMATSSTSIIIQRGSQVLSHLGSSLGLRNSQEEQNYWREMQIKRIQMGHAGLQSSRSSTAPDQVLKKLESTLQSFSSTTSDIRLANASTQNLEVSAAQSESLKRLRSNSLDSVLNIRNRHDKRSSRRIFVSPEVSSLLTPPLTNHRSKDSNTKSPYLRSINDGSCTELTLYMDKRQELLARQNLLKDIIRVAREHYFGKYGIQEEKWKKLVEPNDRESGRQKASKPPFIQNQLDMREYYKPYATITYCLVLLSALCVMTIMHGITEIDLESKIVLRSEVTTFLGIETVARWTVPNVWIGPRPEKLVESGALYAPCLREDISIKSELAKQNKHLLKPRLGCCLIVARQLAATTTEAECKEFTNDVGHWMADEPCSWRPRSTFNESETARPCCVGLQGQCRMVTEKHCQFLNGIFSGHEHCSEIDCLARACGGSDDSAKLRSNRDSLSNEGYSLAQYWRILTSIFLPTGWLSCLPDIPLLYIVGRRIEASAGWPRMTLIYFICSTGGIMFGALFSPLMPHSGGHAAVGGLLGVVSVDIMQLSSIMTFPWTDIFKLCIFLLLEIIVGTLPYIDNYELIGGFLIGVLTAMILLPYISLGKWHVLKRRVLIVLLIPVLLILFALILYLVNTVQTIHVLCPGCLSFTCVPYSDRSCDVMKLDSHRPKLV